MDVSVALAPQLPLWLIGLAAVPALALALYGLFNGTRGSWLRLAGWVFLLLALLNPSLLQEERENLKSVVAVVVDQSGSQALDGRPEQTAAIRERLLASLSQLDAFEIRDINASEQVTRSTDVSTALFRALHGGDHRLRAPPQFLFGGMQPAGSRRIDPRSHAESRRTPALTAADAVTQGAGNSQGSAHFFNLPACRCDTRGPAIASRSIGGFAFLEGVEATSPVGSEAISVTAPGFCSRIVP